MIDKATDFGINIYVDKVRKDGKRMVRFHSRSTGSTIGKIMTTDALDAYLAKNAAIVHTINGYVRKES